MRVLNQEMKLIVLLLLHFFLVLWMSVNQIVEKFLFSCAEMFVKFFVGTTLVWCIVLSVKKWVAMLAGSA